MNKQAREIRNYHICRHCAAGLEVNDIAHRMRVTPMTVSRVLSKKESRALVEKLAGELVAECPDAVDTLRKELFLTKKIVEFLADPAATSAEDATRLTTAFGTSKEMLEFLKITHKQRDNVLKAAGLFPSQAPGLVVNQIYNDNRKQVLGAEVFKALGQHLNLSETEPQDVIDVEPQVERLGYEESEEDES